MKKIKKITWIIALIILEMFFATKSLRIWINKQWDKLEERN